MKRRSRFSFDRRSLALFASLALGSGLAAAQFTVGPASPGATKAPARTADTFRTLDADGNGSISRQEAAGSGAFPAHSFEALDSNGDGVLSRSEFERRSK